MKEGEKKERKKMIATPWKDPQLKVRTCTRTYVLTYLLEDDTVSYSVEIHL
jgi:hypothetical protein